MDQVVRHSISVNVGMDLALVVRVVAQRHKNLGKGEMRKVCRDFLRRDPETPQFDDGPYRGPRALNYGLSAKDILVPDDVAEFGRCRHAIFRSTRARSPARIFSVRSWGLLYADSLFAQLLTFP